MEKQDILDILDSLDVQVSMGKIDQPTYDSLRQKWLSRLQEFESGPVIATSNLSVPPSLNGTFSAQAVASPPPPVLEVLACPRCEAPAEIASMEQDLTKPMQCSYCGTVYTLRQSQDNSQKLKQELKAWLDQMIVGSGYGSSGTIDVNARRFIFSENLYPTLKKEIDRQLEAVEYASEAPFIQIKMLNDFQNYQPNEQLVRVGQGDNQWLKTLITRVSAQQLQDFAVTQDDRAKLNLLSFRVLSLIYYANIAQNLKTPTLPSYQIIRQNLSALQKEYREHARNLTDESYTSYLMAADTRITGSLLLLEVLISALGEQRGVAPEATIDQLDRALEQLNKADQQAASCTYNPLYTVPLQQGIQKDIMAAHIFRAVVKCYEIVTRTQSVEFEMFYEHLMQYVRSLVQIQSPDQLLGLLQSIYRLLAARSGNEPIPILMDWSWLEATVENRRGKPTLGMGGETVGTVIHHFQPYWVATLNYAEKSGLIFKSGTGRSALILVDATSIEKPMIGHLLVNDPNLPALQAGLNTFNFLDQQTMALPALISQDMAEKAMKVYANQRASQLGATIVTMIGLIYLPVAFVRYLSKNGDKREIIVDRLNLVNQNLANMLNQTYHFLHQYGL
ncbi:MAG TPA: hypothetical protein VKV40_02630 [Ktedonobacteraceae bacterium]|nr:hypothetical protein [Ktedonobacteraceae bacterium]